MNSGYFAIKEPKDREHSIYKINYKNMDELIRKVLFITVDPPENTKFIVSMQDRTYCIYLNLGGTKNITITKLDGRRAINSQEYKYSTKADEIDSQFNRVASKYDSIFIKYLIKPLVR